MGGLLFLVCTRVHGHVAVTFASWVAGGANTTEDLRESIRRTLTDMQLTATVE